jgi:hypothetical protein
MRRTAAEIEREFICPYPECGKLYGSEGSLNLHIKIKHNGGNKTEREKMAVSTQIFIIVCVEIGVDCLPEWNLGAGVGDLGPEPAPRRIKQGHKEVGGPLDHRKGHIQEDTAIDVATIAGCHMICRKRHS